MLTLRNAETGHRRCRESGQGASKDIAMPHMNILERTTTTPIANVVDRVWLVPNGAGLYFVYTTASVVALGEPLPRSEAERVAREWAHHTGACYDASACDAWYC
jgi:hypothetical protein